MTNVNTRTSKSAKEIAVENRTAEFRLRVAEWQRRFKIEDDTNPMFWLVILLDSVAQLSTDTAALFGEHVERIDGASGKVTKLMSRMDATVKNQKQVSEATAETYRKLRGISSVVNFGFWPLVGVGLAIALMMSGGWFLVGFSAGQDAGYDQARSEQIGLVEVYGSVESAETWAAIKSRCVEQWAAEGKNDCVIAE